MYNIYMNSIINSLYSVAGYYFSPILNRYSSYIIHFKEKFFSTQNVLPNTDYERLFKENVENAVNSFLQSLHTSKPIREQDLQLQARMERLGSCGVEQLCLDSPQAMHQKIPVSWMRLMLETRLVFDAYLRELKTSNRRPASPEGRIKMMELLIEGNEQEIRQEIDAIEREIQSSIYTDSETQDLSYRRRILTQALLPMNLGQDTKLDPWFSKYEVIPQGDVLKGEGRWEIRKKNQTVYDDARTVFTTHNDRDIGQNTRIKTGKEGQVTRVNTVKKDFDNRWTRNRKRTAAIDRLEAITMYRLLAKEILEGRVDQISLNRFLALKEYFWSVSLNDLAIFPKSYGSDPVFLEARNLFGALEVQLGQAVEQNAIQNLLLKTSSETKFNDTESFKRLEEIVNLFKRWAEDIEKVIQFATETPSFSSIFSWYLEQLKQIQPIVRDLADNFLQNRNKPLPLQDSETILRCLVSDKIQSLCAISYALQTAEASKEIQKERVRLFQEFNLQANTSITNAFQSATRIFDCLEGFLKSIGTHPLRKLGLQALVLVKKEIIKREILLAGNRHLPQSVATYFPNGVKIPAAKS